MARKLTRAEFDKKLSQIEEEIKAQKRKLLMDQAELNQLRVQRDALIRRELDEEGD